MKQQNIMETKLARITQISKERQKEIFTSIYHFLNKEMLMICHKELDGKKTTGLDGITKAEYEEDHKWLIKCVEQHIKDPRIIRLIKRFLKAGIVENTKFAETKEGTPQGSILSPVLANIYMYYVIALWFEKKIKPNMKGETYIIIYADDLVCCFQYKNEAEIFVNKLLPERLKKFNLEVAEDKTRLIEFERFAKENSKDGKVATFDFLGFTHYCSKGRNGKFRVKRKTSRKKFKAKVKEFKIWIKEHKNTKVRELIGMINIKLRGHYQYYGITDNYESLAKFRYCIDKLLWKWLNRRSQRRSYTNEEFTQLMKQIPLLEPKIYVNIYERV